MSILPEPSFGDYLRHLRSASPAGEASKGGRLSRTQLAAGASMSAGYVIKLEQGKAGRPSPDVVDRLAATLGINAVQTRHLHDLALCHRAAEHADPPTEPLVSPVMKEAADNLHPHLCGYLDDMWNVLYCNSEYARIYRHITNAGNVLNWFFFVPESRSIMVEWETEARLTVAWFRALMVRRSAHHMFNDHLRHLARSPDFCRMWSRREIFMGRHSPYMLIRDLDGHKDVCLLAQVYAWPDPTQAVQTYLGIRTDQRPGPLPDELTGHAP